MTLEEAEKEYRAAQDRLNAAFRVWRNSEEEYAAAQADVREARINLERVEREAKR